MKTLTSAVMLGAGLSLMFLGAVTAQAEPAGSLLQLDKGARASALSGALTASPEGPFEFAYNPAGLAAQANPAMGFEHNEWGQGMRGEYLAGASPVFGKGAVGGAVEYFSYGPLDVADENGRVTGETLTPSLLGVKAAYGLSLTPTLALGLQLGYYRESIQGYSDQGSHATAGVLWQAPWPGVTLGLAVRNIGGTASGYQLPGVGAAACTWSGFKNLALHLEIDMPWVERGVETALAAEYQALSWAVLRLGYRHYFNESGAHLPGLAGGAGFFWRNWQLGYALRPAGEFGLTHQISLEYAWNPGEKESAAPDDRKKAESAPPKNPPARSAQPARHQPSFSQKLNAVVQKRFDLGLKQFNAGNFRAAMEQWKLVLEFYPDHGPSLEYLERAEKEIQAQLEAYHQQARQARAQNDLIAEIQAWKKALAVSPADKEAKQGLQTAQARVPEMVQVYYNAGLDHYVKARYPEAIREWEKVILLDPQNYKARENIQKTKEKMIKID